MAKPDKIWWYRAQTRQRALMALGHPHRLGAFNQRVVRPSRDIQIIQGKMVRGGVLNSRGPTLSNHVLVQYQLVFVSPFTRVPAVVESLFVGDRLVRESDAFSSRVFDVKPWGFGLELEFYEIPSDLPIRASWLAVGNVDNSRNVVA